MNLPPRSSIKRLVCACLIGAFGWPCASVLADAQPSLQPAPVSELSQHRASGVVSAWLENGVRVHYRPLFRAPGQVVITVCLFGGELLEDAHTRGLSLLTIAALDDALSPNTAPPDVRRQLGTRDVHIDGIATPDAIMLRISGSGDAVAAGARLAGRALAGIDPDPERLARSREAWAHETAKSEKRGAMLVGQSIVELIYPNADPRTHPVKADDLARFTGEDVSAWLAKHTAANGAPVEAAVVGDVTLEQALSIAREVVGRLPTRPRITPAALSALRREPPGPGPFERTLMAETPEGRAFVVAGFLGIDISKPAQVRLFRAAGRVLQGRVRARLEAAGITRTPEDCDAGVWLSPDPGYGMVIMLASVDPRHPHDAYTVLNDEVDRLAADGPTAEELVQATGTLEAEAEKANREDSRYWSGMLARSTAQGLDPDEVYQGPEFYRSLTPERVHEAVREQWKPEARLGLVIRPREEATPTVGK